MKTVAPKRCAVYCRVSTDERLDQSFNSLDAQKDSGLAYIASQRAEGWIPVPDDYIDPGFSGGNIERPALKRLMADIEAGRIDIVVVYKIDRLTRNRTPQEVLELFDQYEEKVVAAAYHRFKTSDNLFNYRAYLEEELDDCEAEHLPRLALDYARVERCAPNEATPAVRALIQKQRDALEEMSLLPAAPRLARRLLMMAEGYGETGPRRVLHLAQEQLALMLGLSRQTTNQILKDLEARGALRLTYGEIEITDLRTLRQAAGVA